MQRDQIEQCQADQRADEQEGVIAACIYRTQTHGQRVFTVLAVAVDVAQVIDIQHRRRQQTAGGRRQEQGRYHRMRLQVPASHHAQPAEEHQHGDVAQTNIPVRTRPDGIGNGCNNGKQAQHQEANEITGGFRRDRHQRQPGQANQYHGDNQRPFHLCLGNHPFLHPAQRPDTVRLVAALYRIAVIIGEIREDLQQPGGDKRQACYQRIEMTLPPGKRGTDNNGGKSQRKRFRAQTFEPRLCTADISHSYLANKNGGHSPHQQ